MIQPPVCKHDRNNIAPSRGWILSCKGCFENAVRANQMKYANLMHPLQLEDDLQKARERIQKLESDIQDLRMLSKQAFGRCASCDRLKEISKLCRWCAQ